MIRDRILTVEQMRVCEQRSEELGVSRAELMAAAGEKLASHVQNEAMSDGQPDTPEIVILAGKGNNGGDGMVAANHLFRAGISTKVVLCCGKPSTELASSAYNKLNKSIDVMFYDGDPEHPWAKAISDSTIVVDCIFGTGFTGEIGRDLQPLFIHLNTYAKRVIACDIPSGVDATSGQAGVLAVTADITVTMHAKKLGMLLSPAKYFCGEIYVDDIGIPAAANTGDPIMENEIYAKASMLDDSQLGKKFLTSRKPWAHKGTFGKVVCVCGSDSYIGAAGISATAALRMGAGLVEICSTENVVRALSCNLYECIFSAMKSDDKGCMTSDNAEAILEKLGDARALLLGCGIGHTPETEKLVAELTEKSPVPVILDADGINSLVPNIDVLLKKKSTVILTPHPGELARLCGVTQEEVLADRLKYSYGLSKKYGVTVVSKSSETIVCCADRTEVITAGNTALSKGGSGDMLAGLIASLTAQTKRSSLINCILACMVMGRCAEVLSKKRSERGILARDILAFMPFFLKHLEGGEE
ncbi:NAD(P)H-hydrate dehydratase [Ruminococcus sp.]|uniref:NAD(P)H-hydrate dehydratase n=1 Tax=Ruminococcus sp. TaxID=41978 RepID=UPI0025FE21AB|nr:NAD(P)H-hydrate dehydratase [Ruminococcus sp.]MBQ8966172.1 NAD(P)H-hydrate dehydratase [Ruminococcus sp.]